ncbi:hypothetical protein T07_13064 [Trichinella nelsoni]|uniref:CCHC-type domain-containing protein n=1 Tax=Trichinella nelsoni TaxID=6336 RepID=A0A0V0SAT5_9BILA|nr:hypothetical protein T07_13064 [Trichinella nelsoni]
MTLLEKEPMTMDEARRIALKAVEIEEASRNMDELTGAIDWLICRLDDCLPTPARPALTPDVYQRRHQATIEARLERLERTSARPARTGTGCFNCGSLDHLRRNCPQLRPRTRPAGAQRSGSTDRRLLAMTELKTGCSPLVAGKLNGLKIPLLLDSGAVVSVVSESTWRSATKGQPNRTAEGSILSGDG